MEIRAAVVSDLDHLASIWHSRWQDVHAPILSAELARYQTFDSFRDKLEATLPNIRIAEVYGQLVGFSIIKEDELYQLYVSSEVRGTGIAAALLADAEKIMRSRGVESAWLACAIGNKRAADFYSENGWRYWGNMVCELPSPQGENYLEVWRYEKDLVEYLIDL